MFHEPELNAFEDKLKVLRPERRARVREVYGGSRASYRGPLLLLSALSVGHPMRDQIFADRKPDSVHHQQRSRYELRVDMNR